MNFIHRPRQPKLLVSLLLLVFIGSHTQALSPAQAEGSRAQEPLALPYHPLVYHLDLSIFAYQLYARTLVWPFDPYYEEFDNRAGKRAGFMKKVRTWAKAKGAQQVKANAGLSSYRGPGILGGFGNNERHDPIIYQYSRLYPWGQTITQTNGQWTEYMTPREITGKIRDVHMCYRKTGRPNETAIDRVVSSHTDAAPGARDILLAFEGGTGSKRVQGPPASQSLMGFVLLRHWAGRDDYDVHISFRGSRSGSAERAAWQALSNDNAAGNPDWITDLGYNLIGARDGGGHITATGAVARGFAQSVKSILPQLVRCLSAAALAQRRRPNRIYVTGHSLGGALAQHFVSAVLLGNQYGPAGAGDAMPTALRSWPWRQIKLITFSAPRAGDAKWAKALTTGGLESDFFSTRIDPIDRKALAPNHPTIMRRLIDRNRPAGYRVLISSDPMTSEKVPGGKHVGKTVYADVPGLFKLPDVKAHEPRNIRKLLLASLVGQQIPTIAWRYPKPDDINPERKAGRQTAVVSIANLEAALQKYYRDNNLWFDHAAHARDFKLFKNILKAY